MVPDARVVELGVADEMRLGELCLLCSDFFERIEGQPGGPATAAEILGPLPGHVASGTKRVFGVEHAGELVAVAELLDGFPARWEWYVGLLLVLPHLRRGGLGTRIWAGLRDWIRAQDGAVVRLVVQKQNPLARAFWERQGFEVEGEAVMDVGKLSSPSWKMLLHLATAAQSGAPFWRA